MKEFLDWMDNRTWVQKILLCLPIVDVVWGLYRLFDAITRKDTVRIILAAAWILWAGYIGWLLDLISIILTNHIFWFQN
ncbi:MAG TPA: hypothetical protein DDW20_00150 [Firmicutes bacterium]|nr:hypothetical protein [Bacillota bacterium]